MNPDREAQLERLVEWLNEWEPKINKRIGFIPEKSRYEFDDISYDLARMREAVADGDAGKAARILGRISIGTNILFKPGFGRFHRDLQDERSSRQAQQARQSQARERLIAKLSPSQSKPVRRAVRIKDNPPKETGILPGSHSWQAYKPVHKLATRYFRMNRRHDPKYFPGTAATKVRNHCLKSRKYENSSVPKQKAIKGHIKRFFSLDDR